jgi:hypothetical protein
MPPKQRKMIKRAGRILAFLRMAHYKDFSLTG